MFLFILMTSSRCIVSSNMRYRDWLLLWGLGDFMGGDKTSTSSPSSRSISRGSATTALSPPDMHTQREDAFGYESQPARRCNKTPGLVDSPRDDSPPCSEPISSHFTAPTAATAPRAIELADNSGGLGVPGAEGRYGPGFTSSSWFPIATWALVAYDTGSCIALLWLWARGAERAARRVRSA